LTSLAVFAGKSEREAIPSSETVEYTYRIGTHTGGGERWDRRCDVTHNAP